MHRPSLERGMALVSALLLLLVLTMLSVGMFRSFGLQEHLAGNTREKARATHAAEAGQIDAENWLLANAATVAAGAAPTGNSCSGQLSGPQVCSALLTSVTKPDQWPAYVPYAPSTFELAGTGSTTAYNFVQPARYYISFLAQNQPTANKQIIAYQVDAASYAGTTNTVSVVESSYLVAITYQVRTDGREYTYEGGP
jgi:type IV pilus assembly protein PilX